MRFLLLLFLIAAPVLAEERRSGYHYMRPETRAMQDDELANPGMLAVMEGEALWRRYGCHGCHQDMKGVAARYPVYFAESGRPIDLQSRINICRKINQNTTPFPLEDRADSAGLPNRSQCPRH